MFLISCPGFSLAKAAAREYRRNPEVEGLVLLKHGLFTFGETAQQSYARTIDLNNLAAEFVQKNRRIPVFIPRSRSEKEIGRTADIAPVLRGCLANAEQTGIRRVGFWISAVLIKFWNL